MSLKIVAASRPSRTITTSTTARMMITLVVRDFGVGVSGRPWPRMWPVNDPDDSTELGGAGNVGCCWFG